jgi:DNA-binding LacI/PurR family transcriptional regulator
MASDYAAFIACDYCLKRKIDVPAAIAIVGFDDHIVASMRRITSYNYNFAAVASKIVHFLLRPNEGFWSKRRVVEVRGNVMERETA